MTKFFVYDEGSPSLEPRTYQAQKDDEGVWRLWEMTGLPVLLNFNGATEEECIAKFAASVDSKGAELRVDDEDGGLWFTHFDKQWEDEVDVPAEASNVIVGHQIDPTTEDAQAQLAAAKLHEELMETLREGRFRPEWDDLEEDSGEIAIKSGPAVAIITFYTMKEDDES